MTDRAIEILATGPLALLQDAGRPGYGFVGVSRSGAADRRAHTLANRLVGNVGDAATVEVTFGGFRLRAVGHVCVAVTGAVAPLTVDGVVAALSSPLYLAPGDELSLGPPTSGLRNYIGVAGGFDVKPVLGSRSTDTLSGLGPPKLESGAVVAVGGGRVEQTVVDVAPVGPPADGPITVAVLPGPRDDWLADFTRLLATPWRASQNSNRVGVRLDGEPLRRADAYAESELMSEGVVRGSIQVPASGLPVIFLADHPVTGGYPVVAVVRDADSDRIAQARPGQQVRFEIRQGRPT